MLSWTSVGHKRFIASFRLMSALAVLTLSTSACVKAKISAMKSVATMSLSESPTLSFTAPAALTWVNIANVASITVSGTCSSELEGQSVLLRAPGPASALAVCSTGLFSTSMDFTAVAQGSFTLTADATDASGNAATQATLSLQKDTVAPTVAFSSPAANGYVQNSLALSGTCSDDGSTVTLAGTGSLTGSATCTAGAWSATIDITSNAQGAISWTADFTDPAGNPAAQATRSFIKDLTVPTVAITSPAAGAYINIANKAAFTVSGTCSESGRTVSIAASAVTATPSCTGGNTWSATLDLTSLSDGTVTVTADHTNLAGASATQATRNFNKDTVAPTVALTAPLASVKIVTANQSAFPLSGTCSEAGQNVVISGDATATVTCAVGLTWSYSADVSGKADGLISFSVDHSDVAGNPATQSSRNYTKDTTAPAAFTITGVTGGTDVTADAYLLDNLTAVIEWNDTTGEDSYDVVIKKASDNSVMCALVNKAANSTSHDFSTCTLTYGQDYKAVVIGKDNDGNEREATNSPYTFKVNRVPTATADTLLAMKNASASTLNVLSNDTDPDSDTLSVSAINTTGTSGTVTNNTTNVSYTPASNFTGVDTFTYTASDGRGGTSTVTVTVKIVDQFTWTGAVNNNWNQSGNWCGSISAGACVGGAAPNSSQVAIFDNSVCSGTACNATVNATISVGGIKMNTGYAGTITQGAGNTITVGSTGWIVTAGTFTGSSDAITINGPFSQTGGSFTSTSGTLLLGQTITNCVTSTDGWVMTGGTFTHNSGTMEWGRQSPNNGQGCGNKQLFYANVTTNPTLYNLVVNLKDTENQGGYNDSYGTISSGTSMTVSNLLTFKDGYIDGGQIDLTGNLETQCADGATFNPCSEEGGTTVVRFVGTSPKTYTAAANSFAPALQINSTSTFTPAVGTTLLNISTFRLTQGTFEAPTGNLAIYRRGTGCTAGTDGFVMEGGTFTHSNGTVIFGSHGATTNGCGNNITQFVVDVPSSVTLYDLKVDIEDWNSSAGYNQNRLAISTGDNVLVTNNFTHSDGYIAGPGTLEVNGDITVECADTITGSRCAGSGSAVLSWNTATNKTLTATTGGSTTVIAKTGAATGTLSGTEVRMGALDVQAGTLVSTSGTLVLDTIVASSTIFKVAAGAAFTHSSGTIQMNASNSGCGAAVFYVDVDSSVSLYNLTYEGIFGGPCSGNYPKISIAAGDTVVVANDFNMTNGWHEGAIQVGRHLTYGANARGGTGTILFNGAGAQTVTAAVGATTNTGAISVNKAGGTLTLGSAISWNATNQDLLVTAGAIDMAGYALTVKRTLSLNGQTLTKNGGTLTVNSVVAGTGSLFGGTVDP